MPAGRADATSGTCSQPSTLDAGSIARASCVRARETRAFMVPGGTSGGYRQTFPGMPSLQAGMEYVLFLWTSPSSRITHLVGLNQGVLNVNRLNDGTTEVKRDAIGENIFDSAGHPVRDLGLEMPMASLKTRVLGGAGAAGRAGAIE